jgi:hypothetical protein
MKGSKKGSILTAKDALLWAQRIQKEEINCKVNPDGFLVHGAIRTLDVPKRFKPGHCDPTKPPPDEGFPAGSKNRKDLERCLREKEAPRRDRYLWPETSCQDHGWYQKDPARGPEVKGRTTMTGALPTFNGIGWRDKRYEDKVYKKIAPEGLFSLSAANDKEYHVKPPPPRPGGPADRPPYAFVSREAMRVAMENAKKTHGGRMRAESHCGADRRSQSLGALGHSTDPTSKVPDTPSGAKVTAACRSISEGNLGVMSSGSTIKNADDHICTESFDAAMARHRIFMNRQPQYKWYVPLTNSDVAEYVDNYTKCFGKQYYAKSSQTR